MNKIEKRELVEQRRKNFEAGVQRADKRTGSVSFLTWAFFIAPWIASHDFLAAVMGKSVTMTEEHVAAAQINMAPHLANDDPPATDLSKMSAEAEREAAHGTAASSAEDAPQVDRIGLAPQPHEGGNEADGGHRTSFDDPSIYSLSADSQFGSSQLPGESAPESDQSNVLAASWSSSTLAETLNDMSQNATGTMAPVQPATPAVLTPLGNTTADTLTTNVASTLAPVEAATQPALATLGDSVDTLTKDVTSTLTPAEAATQPVLATVSDTVDTLTMDVGTLARVEAATQPVLATLGNTTADTLTKDVASTLVPVEAATQPALATLSDSVDTLTKDVTSTLAPVEAATQPVLTIAADSVDTLSKDTTHAPSGEAATQPVLTTMSDSADTVTKDVTHTAPAEAATQPVLTSMGDSADTSTKDVTHSAQVEAATQPVLTTVGDSTDTLTKDATHAPPDVGANEPVTTTAAAPGEPSADVSHPAETLLALATATDASIQVPESTTTAPPNTGAPAHPIDVAGDVINLNDAPAPPANALFTGTQYTQYGVALSSDAAASAHDPVSSDATSAQHTSAPPVADVQQHALSPPDVVDPTHSTDHLAHAIL